MALVSVLAGGDYLLWDWSLQGSHDVLALISGLTLPPLAIALIWLLALNATRLLAQIARAPRQQHPRTTRMPQQPTQQHQSQPRDDQQQQQQQQASSSSKLAA